MSNVNTVQRPESLAEVAERSGSLEEFGFNLREWEHHISRDGITSRPALFRELEKAPPKLANKFDGGDIADAYLAALAEWLCSKHKLRAIKWTKEADRITGKAWWAHTGITALLASTPASFRTRHLFTNPNDPFRPKAGRPPVPKAVQIEKRRARQKRYRERIRKLIAAARESSRGTAND